MVFTFFCDFTFRGICWDQLGLVVYGTWVDYCIFRYSELVFSGSESSICRNWQWNRKLFFVSNMITFVQKGLSQVNIYIYIYYLLICFVRSLNWIRLNLLQLTLKFGFNSEKACQKISLDYLSNWVCKHQKVKPIEIRYWLGGCSM